VEAVSQFNLSPEDQAAVLRGEKVLVDVRWPFPRPDETVEFYEPLTADEKAVMRKLTDAWNLFMDLPRCHPMEVQEGVTFIHGLQSLVMVRAAVRAYPEMFTHVDGFK
jgi:hypothetical protein